MTPRPGSLDAGLAAIDWSRPWLDPWRARGEPLAESARAIGVVAALDEAALAAPTELRAGHLRFVEAAALPQGAGYEAFIAATARVPTRSNRHDFFNGLAWLRHGAFKRRLNELQAAHGSAEAAGRRRGAVRDALTLFDENGALLRAPGVLVEALAARDWQALFLTHRAVWTQARLELFGHALLDKLVRPRKAITAHVWVVPEDGSEAVLDRFAADMAAAQSAAACFRPLPVLGVPGWWSGNEAAGFYADAQVFRPRRHRPAGGSGP